jgi:hypothetical protein
MRPSRCMNRPPKERAQGNAGCPMHPQPRVRKNKAHERSHHRYPGTPGIPCAMVLTAYFVLSPVSEFVLSPSSANMAGLKARSGQPASTDLTPATGARTTRLCRPRQHRSSARASSAHRPIRACPAIPARARRCRVHRIPPRVNDDGQRPSSGTGRRGYRSDLGKTRSRIFLQKGLDRIH